MSTEEHFLFAARGDNQPSRLVGVSCDVEETEAAAMGSVRRQTLARWGAAGWTAKSGVVRERWEKVGYEASSFWDATRYALKRDGKTWVVAWQAVQVLGLLGAWEMIEDGRLHLVGSGSTSGSTEPDREPLPDLQGGDPDLAADGRRGAVPGVPRLRGRGVSGHSGNVRQAGGKGQQTGAAIIENPPTILQLRMPDLPGTIHVVDLRNYGIGGYPYDLPVVRRAGWTAQCMEEMCRILRVYGLGALQSTSGGQAMHTFRRRFLTHSVWCHRNPEALEMERSALVGGRCECFRLGKIEEPVYHVDFRSLYPSVCASANLPCRLVATTEQQRQPLRNGRVDAYLALADVTVRTDEPAYPYRNRSHIVYPVGRFRTVLAGPELTDAHDHDRIECVHEALMYEGAPALRAYATEMYAILDEYRHAGHPPTVQWLKSMLVCLPGKFAQRDSRWVAAPEVTAPAPWSDWFRRGKGGETVRHRSLGGNVEREVGNGFAFNASPAIACWVNSAGRIALLNAMRTAGRESLFYCDTDSLMLSHDGFRRLESANMVGSGELGRLRLVARYSTAIIHGIKHYEVDGKRVCAGVPIDPRDHDERGQGYWYNNWIKRQIASNHRPEVERILRRYARGATYVHGSVGVGGIVSPWRIEA